MGSNVPVPAETLRRLAIVAGDEVIRAREDDRKATARDIQRKVSDAMDAASEKDGEFASVSAETIATLAAFGWGDASDGYHEGLDHYLSEYLGW